MGLAKVIIAGVFKRLVAFLYTRGLIDHRLRIWCLSNLRRISAHLVYSRDLDGLPIWVNALDISIGHSLILHNSYESPETALVKRMVNRSDVVVDVGANIGYYTLLAAKLIGSKGRVFAFEPEQYNFMLLGKNVEVNHFKNVTSEQIAIGENNGSLKLFVDFSNLGNHSEIQAQHYESFVVEKVSIDSYFKPRQRVDFVKIDVQGTEEHVLRGMRRVVSENPGIKIMLEVCPDYIGKSGLCTRNLFSLIKRIGLRMYEITDKGDIVQREDKFLDGYATAKGYINILLQH